MRGGLMKNMTTVTFESLVGQNPAKRLLSRMVDKDRVAHALLFTGIDGIGKQTVAKALAMALNCRKLAGVQACKKCPSCRKMLSDNHPDLIIVEPSGTFIKIDQVRNLRKRLMFAPVQGGRRMVVVNDSHAMNAEASNAMLKMLEEPPDNTHIVLTAPQTSDLLPTIVSRCQHIAFEPLSFETIAQVLRENQDIDAESARAIAILAKGSLGKALSTETQRWMTWRKELHERINGIGNASRETLFGFAETLARDKDRLPDALDVIIVWFRDLMMAKFHPDKILNQDCSEVIQRKAREYTVDDLLAKIMTVSDTQRAISRNANRRLALEVMMMQLTAACGDKAVSTCKP
jgi:DNA polymerase-3 subunit delta'